jgi:hypothetical protein
MHRVDFGSGFLYVFYGTEGLLTHTIYIEKALYRANFAILQVGSNISEVEQIDPATSQHRLLAEELGMQDFNSYHLLKDALLVISYEKNENGEFEVTAIAFHEDFVLRSFMDFDFAIRPEDFPR